LVEEFEAEWSVMVGGKRGWVRENQTGLTGAEREGRGIEREIMKGSSVLPEADGGRQAPGRRNTEVFRGRSSLTAAAAKKCGAVEKKRRWRAGCGEDGRRQDGRSAVDRRGENPLPQLGQKA
jgi:hypothetical protein